MTTRRCFDVSVRRLDENWLPFALPSEGALEARRGGRTSEPAAAEVA
jgi:hypothetical protein